MTSSVWKNSCTLWYSPGVLVPLVRVQSCVLAEEAKDPGQNSLRAFLQILLLALVESCPEPVFFFFLNSAFVYLKLASFINVAFIGFYFQSFLLYFLAQAFFLVIAVELWYCGKWKGGVHTSPPSHHFLLNSELWKGFCIHQGQLLPHSSFSWLSDKY